MRVNFPRGCERVEASVVGLVSRVGLGAGKLNRLIRILKLDLLDVMRSC